MSTRNTVAQPAHRRLAVQALKETAQGSAGGRRPCWTAWALSSTQRWTSDRVRRRSGNAAPRRVARPAKRRSQPASHARPWHGPLTAQLQQSSDRTRQRHDENVQQAPASLTRRRHACHGSRDVKASAAGHQVTATRPSQPIANRSRVASPPRQRPSREHRQPIGTQGHPSPLVQGWAVARSDVQRRSDSAALEAALQTPKAVRQKHTAASGEASAGVTSRSRADVGSRSSVTARPRSQQKPLMNRARFELAPLA